MRKLAPLGAAIGAALLVGTAAVQAQPASMPMGASGAMASSSIGMADKTFVVEATIGGMTEVELGKLAASKGTSQAVKDFGSKMVDDHIKAGDELKTLATGQGITPPNRLDGMHQQLVDKFTRMPAGARWDKAYHDQMVADHKKTITLFQKESGSGKNADLKGFAAKTLPTIKEHLQMLQAKM